MTCTLVLDTHGRSGTGRSWLDALAAGPLASTSAGAAISSHNIAPGYFNFDNIINHRSSKFQPSRVLLKRGSKRHTSTTEPITLTFRIAERRLKHTNTPVARERPPEMSNHGHLKPLPDRQPGQHLSGRAHRHGRLRFCHGPGRFRQGSAAWPGDR